MSQIHEETNGFAEDDWSVDVSQEAVERRMREISSGAAVLTVSDDLEKTPTERANLLHSFIKERVDNGTIKSKAVSYDTYFFRNTPPIRYFSFDWRRDEEDFYVHG